MLCPKCRLWTPKQGDRYCGWCGDSFTPLLLELAPSVFDREELPPPARLRLVNRSSQRVAIRSIRSNREWLCPPPALNVFELEPQQRQSFYVNVDIFRVPGEHDFGAVVVESDVGEDYLPAEVLPNAKVEVVLDHYEIFLDSEDFEQNFARIEVREGAVTVYGVSAEPAEWITVVPAADVRFPVRLGGKKSILPLRFLINEDSLRRVVKQYPEKLEGVLRIACDDLERAVKFEITCWKPPQIWVWEEEGERWRAYLGRSGRYALTVQNASPRDSLGGEWNAPLEIRRIDILNEDLSPCGWARLEDDSDPVVQIRGGQRRQFAIRVDTGQIPGLRSFGPRPHLAKLVFQITTNMPVPVYRLEKEIEVLPMPEFDGILAVDFGTSNSCCAVLGRRDLGFRLLAVDSQAHNPEPAVVPTIIRFLERNLVEIGAEVEATLADPKSAASTVRSPKRYLGREDSSAIFEVNLYRGSGLERLTAREVATEFLREIRKRAEEQLCCFFREIVITHPARFRLRQLQELEAAVREAFGVDCRITLIQEPVAAALELIVGNDLPESGRHTLGVFDFGGGTTDLSLLEVERTQQGGIRTIVARLASSTGRWFGGEDLTRFVLERGLESCSAIARDALAAAEIPLAPVEGAEPRFNWHARINQHAMQRWAEETKLLLFAHGDDHIHHLPLLPGIFPGLRLHVYDGSDFATQEFPHERIVPRRADLEAYLENELDALAGMMKGMLLRSRCEKLDFLLLSGKSSVIPAVGRVLARHFPGAAIRKASRLKECVVSGACALARFRQSPDTLLMVENLAATPTRIGLEDLSAGIFREWLPAGQPIPEEGLRCRRPYILRPDSRIQLLENDGDDDRLWIDNRRNRDIADLGAYRLPFQPEWLPEGRALPVELELEVSQALECTLTVYQENSDDGIRLVPAEE